MDLARLGRRRRRLHLDWDQIRVDSKPQVSTTCCSDRHTGGEERPRAGEARTFSNELKGCSCSLVNVFATECENGIDLVIEHYTWEWLSPLGLGVHPVPSSIYNFAASEQEFFSPTHFALIRVGTFPSKDDWTDSSPRSPLRQDGKILRQRPARICSKGPLAP